MLKKVKGKAKKIMDTIKKHGHNHQHQGGGLHRDEDEDPQVHGAPSSFLILLFSSFKN